MKWEKYMTSSGDEYFSPLPEDKEDLLPNNETYDVVVIAQGFCQCSIVNAYNNGELEIFDDIPHIDMWSTTDISAGEEDGDWLPVTFDRFFKGAVRLQQTKKQVNIPILQLDFLILPSFYFGKSFLVQMIFS